MRLLALPIRPPLFLMENTHETVEHLRCTVRPVGAGAARDRYEFFRGAVGRRCPAVRGHDVQVDRDIELPEDICRYLFDRDDRVWPCHPGWTCRALARWLCAILAPGIAAADGRDLFDPRLPGRTVAHGAAGDAD